MRDMDYRSLLGGRLFKYILLFGLATFLFSLALFALYGVSPLATWQVVLGLAYLMFLPGYLLCWVMFPDEQEINSVERLGLSLGLSIPVTLITVLVLDQLFKIPITALNIILGLGALMAALSAVGLVRGRLSKGK